MTTSPLPPIAAIFDMDDTLLNGSSGRMLFSWLREKGMLNRYFRRRDIPQVILAAILYKLHRLDPTWLILRMGRSAAGADAGEMWAISRRWFDEMLVPAINQDGVARLGWHVEQGHLPVICSGSSQLSTVSATAEAAPVVLGKRRITAITPSLLASTPRLAEPAPPKMIPPLPAAFRLYPQRNIR